MSWFNIIQHVDNNKLNWAQASTQHIKVEEDSPSNWWVDCEHDYKY